VKRGEFVFDPTQMNGGPPILIGLNATFDGTLIAASLDGSVIAVDRSLTPQSISGFRAERFWNSIAVDEQGGVYAVSDKRLHKLVWTGRGFSTRAEDGAWSEPTRWVQTTRRCAARGSGTTPTLLGLESDRDQFVLIADAANVNNLVLYWRDAIPEDWEQLEGRPRRIAGKAPVDFGRGDLTDSYSENSPIALGYGTVIANNKPSNGMGCCIRQPALAERSERGAEGRAEVAWDPQRRAESAWVRPGSRSRARRR
jgi:hypothetical protein